MKIVPKLIALLAVSSTVYGFSQTPVNLGVKPQARLIEPIRMVRMPREPREEMLKVVEVQMPRLDPAVHCTGTGDTAHCDLWAGRPMRDSVRAVHLPDYVRVPKMSTQVQLVRMPHQGPVVELWTPQVKVVRFGAVVGEQVAIR